MVTNSGRRKYLSEKAWGKEAEVFGGSCCVQRAFAEPGPTLFCPEGELGLRWRGPEAVPEPELISLAF